MPKGGFYGKTQIPKPDVGGSAKASWRKQCLSNRQELGDMVEDEMEEKSNADKQKSSYEDMETTEHSVSRWFHMS